MICGYEIKYIVVAGFMNTEGHAKVKCKRVFFAGGFCGPY